MLHIATPALSTDLHVSFVRPDDNLWDEAIALEYAIFHDAGFSGTAAEHDHNYTPYTERSVLGVVQRDEVVVGMTRLILALELCDDFRTSGFKAINDTITPSAWGSLDISPEGWNMLRDYSPQQTIEVATNALAAPYRTGILTRTMTTVQVAFSCAVGGEKPAILASFDKRHYQGIRRTFANATVPLGKMVQYGNGPTINALTPTKTLVSNDSRGFLVPGIIDATYNAIHEGAL